MTRDKTTIWDEVNQMKKSNIHKKETFESKFDRKYACWVKNNRKAWRWWKRKNRKDFRRKQKEQLKKEILDVERMENNSNN